MPKDSIGDHTHDVILVRDALAKHGVLRLRLTTQVFLDGTYHGLRCGTILFKACSTEVAEEALRRILQTLKAMS